jgi:hypothetical protein
MNIKIDWEKIAEGYEFLSPERKRRLVDALDAEDKEAFLSVMKRIEYRHSIEKELTPERISSMTESELKLMESRLTHGIACSFSPRARITRILDFIED